MKILIAPMAAMSETSGPYERARMLSLKLLAKGHEVAFCAANDANYCELPSTHHFLSPTPSPLGLPAAIGTRFFKIAQMLSLPERKKIENFEQVLRFTGAIHKRHFALDVNAVRNAISLFKPDLVYSEFRPSAIVASRLEHVKVVTGYSYPVQSSFAPSGRYSKAVRKFVDDHNLPHIKTVLDIFDWADLKIVPSSKILEPIEDENVLFTGPFKVPSISQESHQKNKILVYMGYGTISPNIVIHQLSKIQTDCDICIATKQCPPFQKNNIFVEPYFDFEKLMPQATAFINHGGQNSIMTGLLYGVPQIIYPGNVFERQYNATSVVHLHAGIKLEMHQFTSAVIEGHLNEFSINPIYADNAKLSGQALLDLGGADLACEALEKTISTL